MCVYVDACVNGYVCIRECVWMWMCVCVCLYVCEYVCTCEYVNMCVCVCLYVCLMRVCVFVHVCMCVQAMDEDDDMFGEGYFPVNPDDELMADNLQPTKLSELNFDDTQIASAAHVEKTVPVEKVSVESVVHAVVQEAVPVKKVVSVVHTLVSDSVPLISPPVGSKFLSIKSSIGDRAYLVPRAPSVLNGGAFACVLQRPFHELLAASVASVQTRDEDLMNWIDRKHNSIDSDNRQFVDKYKPTKFIDLLSDDSVNRQFMMWLSEWKKNLHSSHPGIEISPVGLGVNSIVVPVAAPPAPPAPKTGMDRPSNQWESLKKGASKWTKFEPQVEQQSTKPVLPNRKILLLGGPPGVGKSALIDVCAKLHFQYTVIESSSADDRGKHAMTKLITDVCSNRSVLDSTKPQLLVIDEIDGDECTAIDVLHAMNPELIKRPIICVCSDVWNRKMKPIRDIATVIAVPPPRALSLCSKLKQICAIEHIQMESMAIDRLVNLCEADIRAVLNQLQALAARASKNPYTVQDVMKYCSPESLAAVKDTHKSEMELMSLIFEPKRSRTINHIESISNAIEATGQSASDIFMHCVCTIAFSDVCFRHMKNLFETIVFGGPGLGMKYATVFCSTVGKPRIDVIGARKLIASRYHSKTDRESVLTSIRKSAVHSVAASKFMSGDSIGIYSARLLTEILLPNEDSTKTKKSNFIHPEIQRIADIYASFGIVLGGDDSSVVETNRMVFIPNLLVLIGGDTREIYLVGSPMGETLKNATTTSLLKIRSANDPTVELVAKGSKRTNENNSFENQKKSKLQFWGNLENDNTKNVLKNFPFEFRYNEGHTNAVRRVLRLKDFLPKQLI